MSNTNIHILTKNEYKMTRCQDGIILLFPIEGQLKLQHFTKTVNVENDIYVINNTDIFSILKIKTIMLYIASDWFRDRHFDFFNYKYSTNLVKSINSIKRALLQLVLKPFKRRLSFWRYYIYYFCCWYYWERRRHWEINRKSSI